MLIRQQYFGVLDGIADSHGRVRGQHIVKRHIIGRNASLQRCIDYALHYFRENDTQPHYRYDRYYKTIERLLDRCGSVRRTRHVVHLDLGCGPGLFSWALHDYFSQNEPNTVLEVYGYDHAPSMTRLARLIWSELDGVCDAQFTHDSDELTSLVMQGGPPADVIVSFGHVLVQIARSASTKAEFARILASVRLQSSLVVAVDAIGGAETFEKVCSSLAKTLWSCHRLVVDPMEIEGSRLFGVLTDRRSHQQGA